VLGPVIWNGGLFACAAAGATNVFTSSDSIVWQTGSTPANIVLIETLGSWEGGFVALVRTNHWTPASLLCSTDCRSWSEERIPADTLSLVVTSGDWLLASRGYGSRTFHARRAGETNWTTHELPWVAKAFGVTYSAPAGGAFGHDTFLLTHGGGFVVQSDPVTNKAPRLTQPLSAVAITPDASVLLRAMASGSSPMRYQWRRDGTNLPAATSPFLTLSAREVSSSRITVMVENAFGMVESDPATVTIAEPARLEIAADLASLRVWGTPYGRYRIEFTQDLAPAPAWSAFGEIEVPSFGTPARVKDLSAYDYTPVPQRFYRAVIRP
jgi:hypothetical protein